jgi:hypothetical protein
MKCNVKLKCKLECQSWVWGKKDLATKKWKTKKTKLNKAKNINKNLQKQNKQHNFWMKKLTLFSWDDTLRSKL